MTQESCVGIHRVTQLGAGLTSSGETQGCENLLRGEQTCDLRRHCTEKHLRKRWRHSQSELTVLWGHFTEA